MTQEAIQVSVIMAVFNTRSTLGAAIESVRLQSGITWELLIIDDHSTDGSWELALQYAKADPRIQALKTEGPKRCGGGGGRNTGLGAATGATCMFLDGDDAYPPDTLRSLHAVLAENKSQVARGLMTHFCKQRWLAGKPDFQGAPGSVNAFAMQSPVNAFTLYIYKMDLLRQNNVVFPENMGIGEDIAFLTQIHTLIDPKIPLLNKATYIYRINHKPVAPNGYKSKSFLHLVRHACALYEKAGMTEAKERFLRHFFLRDWLLRLQAPLAENRESALAFLTDCMDIIAQNPFLQPDITQQLKGDSVRFLQAVESRNAIVGLEILEQAECITPLPFFMGIDRDTTTLSWHLYRICRRFSSLASPCFWRTIYYFSKLKRLSRRTLGKASAGDRS